MPLQPLMVFTAFVGVYNLCWLNRQRCVCFYAVFVESLRKVSIQTFLYICMNCINTISVYGVIFISRLLLSLLFVELKVLFCLWYADVK